MRHVLLIALLVAALVSPAHAEDGYRLWLRYASLPDAAQRALLRTQLRVVAAPNATATQQAIRAELRLGLAGLLGQEPEVSGAVATGGTLLVGTPSSNAAIAALDLGGTLAALGPDGFLLRHLPRSNTTVIAATSDLGALYGTFAFLRRLQHDAALQDLDVAERPRIGVRMLNHWDNLTGTVERGQAGNSLWDWFALPEILEPRYRDYARANASIGINGTVLNNVNANAQILTRDYLEKVAALAAVFRPYGVRVFLSARFSAPMELDAFANADPASAEVMRWWQDKVAEIYQLIPDFGGFLVKANSEGQPGPQDYGRNHAEGANLLARALAPHGGIVLWRAFVYAQNNPADRHTQAFAEFAPLDGSFLPNVAVQVKNGPIDFMPREPFHPLFGAMPQTPLALEFQIAQEYLGGAYHLAYLAPLFEEVLDADTFRPGIGATVARVVAGERDQLPLSVIAGVANTGDKRNWTGHSLAQANWYAFGRLAWDPELDSRGIAEEWVRQTLTNDAGAVAAIVAMLLESREAVVDYSMPLGLHHLMARGHHYGPGPWVEQGRPDWTSTYYHQASKDGLGFERTAQGSNALAQYAPEIAARWGDLGTVPDELLLWFHHVPWEHRLRSGRTVWEELGWRYQRGVDAVRRWRRTWETLRVAIDPERHAQVTALLARQEREAIEYKDAVLLYFQSSNTKPWPAAAEPAAHDLEYYRNLRRRYVPGDPGSR